MQTLLRNGVKGDTRWIKFKLQAVKSNRSDRANPEMRGVVGRGSKSR